MVEYRTKNAGVQPLFPDPSSRSLQPARMRPPPPARLRPPIPYQQAPGQSLAPFEEPDDQISQTTISINHYNKLGLLFSCVLIFLIGGWAVFATISGAVISQATVVVEGNAQQVQHLEGGIITRILVQEGQFVEKGTELIQLDSTKARSNAEFLNARISSLNKQLILIDEELKGLNKLFKKGLLRKSRVLAVNGRKAELEGQRNESYAQLKAANDEIARSVARAPSAGYVHQLNVHTVGGVVRPGDAIMQIIPKLNKLILEAKIEPRSIDKVKIGQDVVVRFSAFDQRTTPELNGEVSLVSADLTKENVELPAFYKIQIKLHPNELKRLNAKKLKPGMPAEVFVQTGTRTVLSYLLKPLADQMSRTFREN